MQLLGVVGLIALAMGGFIAGAPVVADVLPVNPIALGVALTVLAVAVRSRGYANWPRVWPVVTLVVSCLFGHLLTVNTSYGDDKRIQMLTLVPLCVAGAMVVLQCRPARKIFTWGIVGAGVLMALLALTAPDVMTAESAKLSLEGSNTVATGRAVGGAVVVLASLAIGGARRPLVLAGGAGTLGAIMLATGARGPLVACALAVLLPLLSRGTIGRRLRAVLIAAGGAAAAWWWADRQGYFVERLTTVADTSAQIRLDLYRAAWDTFASRPLGSGWGSLSAPMSAATGWPFNYPHNILLEAAAEAGVLGLVGLLWVVVWAARIQWRRRRGAPVEVAIMALLIFYFTSAMVSGDLPSHRTLWVVLGGCLVTLLPDPPGASAARPLEGQGRPRATVLPKRN